MTKKTLRQVSFIFFIAFAAGLFLYISMPYITAVILAVVYAVLVKPIHSYFTSIFSSNHFATTLTLLVSIVSVVLPLSLLFVLFAQSMSDLHSQLQASDYATVDAIAYPILELGEFFGLEIDLSTSALLRETLVWFSANFNHLFSATVNIVLSIFVWLLLSYFIVKDGRVLHAFVTETSPLGIRSTARILDRLQNMVNAVFRVSLMMGLFQGIMAGIGFWIFGVPYAFALGALTAVLALLPAIGVTLVMVITSVYLFYTVGVIWAFGLLLWGAIVVGLAEDILRPYIVGRYNDVHAALILVSVLGGISVFGIIGLILGPIILAFFLAMLDATREELAH